MHRPRPDNRPGRSGVKKACLLAGQPVFSIPASKREIARGPCAGPRGGTRHRDLASDVLKRFDLSGRTAVITGGGGDLCGHMVEALGAMGVRVAVLDIGLDKAEARAAAVVAAGGSARG